MKLTDKLNSILSLLEDFDLKREFNDLNQRYFGSELYPIPLSWFKSKAKSGVTMGIAHKDNWGRIERMEVTGIKISDYFTRDEDTLRKILAHEMIHAFMMQNNLQDNAMHGYRFKAHVNRLKSLGIDIPLDDDLPKEYRPDELNKSIGVILYKRSGLPNGAIMTFDKKLLPDYFKKVKEYFKGTTSEMIAGYSNSSIAHQYPIARTLKLSGYQLQGTDDYNQIKSTIRSTL